jgi:hypothetical protein
MTAGTVGPDWAEQAGAAAAPRGTASASVVETASADGVKARRSQEKSVVWRMRVWTGASARWRIALRRRAVPIPYAASRPSRRVICER